MNYSFDIEEANEYGVEPAVMLHNIKYWVMQNRAKNKNYKSGKYWTYNSASEFAKLFPFWSPRKIARILAKLEEDGAIESANHNKLAYDRTKWYTLSDLICQNCPMDLSGVSNGLDKSDQPIPDSKHRSKNTDNKPNGKEGFEGITTNKNEGDDYEW